MPLGRLPTLTAADEAYVKNMWSVLLMKAQFGNVIVQRHFVRPPSVLFHVSKFKACETTVTCSHNNTVTSANHKKVNTTAARCANSKMC